MRSTHQARGSEGAGVEGDQGCHDYCHRDHSDDHATCVLTLRLEAALSEVLATIPDLVLGFRLLRLEQIAAHRDEPTEHDGDAHGGVIGEGLDAGELLLDFLGVHGTSVGCGGTDSTDGTVLYIIHHK